METPELDILDTVIDQVVLINDFLDFLSEKNYDIGKWTETNNNSCYFDPVTVPRHLIYEYFELDRNKIEEERRGLLEEIREEYKKDKSNEN